jgi:hypothetical protein
VLRTLALLVGLLSLRALGAEFVGHARLWVGPGFDSNAKRDFVSPNAQTAADGFLYGLGQLEGQVTFDTGIRLQAGYDLSGRKFWFLPSEDTVLQAAQVEATFGVSRFFNVGVLGRARDRRGAERDYSDLQGGAFVDFLPDAHVDVRLSVVAHRFLYWNRFAYSWWGPDAQLTARYRFDRRHSLGVFGAFNPRTYNADATPRPGPMGEPPPPVVRRTDSAFGAGLSYSYRGPFHLSVGYGYFDQTSNSWGETIRRHRISLTAGVHLPLDFTVLLSGALQLASYPDGVYLAPELTVVEDDENASSVTVKLVRPLVEHLELDARYGFYRNVLPTNGFVYQRHVVSLGLTLSY